MDAPTFGNSKNIANLCAKLVIRAVKEALLGRLKRVRESYTEQGQYYTNVSLFCGKSETLVNAGEKALQIRGKGGP
jgi:hypothetical protein